MNYFIEICIVIVLIALGLATAYFCIHRENIQKQEALSIQEYIIDNN